MRDEHLKDIIGRNGATTKDEPDTGRPDLQGPYRAFGLARPKYLTSMLIYFNAEGRRLYGRKKIQVQYRDLETDNPKLAGFDADGQGFSFVLAGQVSKQRVIVKGRNLEEGYDLISFHRMSFIRAADRDFVEDGEPVITSIVIEEIAQED